MNEPPKDSRLGAPLFNMFNMVFIPHLVTFRTNSLGRSSRKKCMLYVACWWAECQQLFTYPSQKFVNKTVQCQYVPGRLHWPQEWWLTLKVSG